MTNFITNEDGDVKVINSNGEVKWFSPYIVNDLNRMKSMGFKALEAPVKAEPVFITESEQTNEETNVGNVAKPKRSYNKKQ